MAKEFILAGKVAYDVENAQWVMFQEDCFEDTELLYNGINAELERAGEPKLQVGDEILVRIKRRS